jgi:hypothetical protein
VVRWSKSASESNLTLQRWVGLGVIADNLVNIGRAMEKRTAP